MYLGWGADQRRKQLLALQAVVTGYALALHQHAVGQEDLATIAELEAFLRERSSADNRSGIDQILARSATDVDAWDRVWVLIDEFRKAKGHAL